MAVFKCKMCGGSIDISEGMTTCECEYCGTKQTLPRLDDDRRVNLYDRANHFRRNNDFDKASGIYEQILNEDGNDAEAYWSLVLCRYGIEYVEDPVSHRRVPTVNRTQFTSVFDDDNYKSALEHADAYQRTIYEEEAKTINEIQKGILTISQKEEPFDVFICYKETDNSGRRTPDSVLANDLYHQLTQEGFKVFYSRITLEDKLGTAYEPYIFAALNSAKVMVVLGTKPEFFNAVWVKNEWSRYLSIVKQSAGKKVLIPAFRDMDPYDLPEEFSHLQALDMSKLGFMQDLIHGIEKIVKVEDPKTKIKETVVVGGVNANCAPLLERAFLFLEDGKWEDADIYCEKVLDIDPKNAEAYLGKLMADLQVRSRNQLADCAKPFDDRENYGKVLRFGNEKLKNEMHGYIAHIKERNENTRITDAYNSAVSIMNTADNESSFKAAADKFKTISGFKNADELANQCLEKAEVCRKDAIYESAHSKQIDNSIAGCENAISLYESILGWKDSDKQIYACQQKIEEIKAKQEAARIESERLKELKRIAAEKAAKKRKRIIAIVTPIVVVSIAFVIVLPTVIIPTVKYNSAVNLYNEKKYNEAIAAFTELDGFKDSEEQRKKCYIGKYNSERNSAYNSAVNLYNEKKYDEAIAAFTALGSYKDSKEQIEKCYIGKYNSAVAAIEKGDIINAYETLINLNGYKDSNEKASKIVSKYIKKKLQQLSIGEFVYFGSYEQDNNSSNGKEAIEWLLLAKKGNKALLISKYALDCRRYSKDNNEYYVTAWQDSDLRKWLNGNFFRAAFNSEEKTRITDKPFLLSISEAEEYFSSDSKRKCSATEYAIAQGADNDENGCYWWLCTPGGYDNDYVACVVCDGRVYDSGFHPTSVYIAVRPALWINLES